MVRDTTGNTRLRRTEPKTTGLGIRELPVNVKNISLEKWELQLNCKKVGVVSGDEKMETQRIDYSLLNV